MASGEPLRSYTMARRLKLDPILILALGGLGYFGYRAYTETKSNPSQLPFSNIPPLDTNTAWGNIDQAQVIKDVAAAARVSQSQVAVTNPPRHLSSSDSSFGCPRPGMAYAQIVEPIVEVICQVRPMYTSWRWAVPERGGSPVVCQI